MKTGFIVYILFLSITSMICLLILMPVILKLNGYIMLSNSVYIVFARVCHQINERSLIIFGSKLAVCARCTGVYIGLMISTLAYPIIKRIDDDHIPQNKILLLATLPIAIDGLTQLFGVRNSINILRVSTGLLFGSVIPFYLIPIFTDITTQLFKYLNKNGRHN